MQYESDEYTLSHRIIKASHAILHEKNIEKQALSPEMTRVFVKTLLHVFRIRKEMEETLSYQESVLLEGSYTQQHQGIEFQVACDFQQQL